MLARGMEEPRRVKATRYVTPLREGGSLPAIVEADDLGTYVLKFRGAGQGRKALIAELVAGEIGRKLGLAVPEIVFVELDPELARAEPDAEIQDLVRWSAGLNLALDYLPGAFGFDPLARRLDPALAARVAWFDALVTNVDRTAHNTNLLLWHEKVWLIDHGAALYFHHSWSDWRRASQRTFAAAREHVLLPQACDVREADAELAPKLDPGNLRSVLNLIPAQWLAEEPGFEDAAAVREAYLEYLSVRLEEPREWVQALEETRERLL
jgi:hypothetical protein